MHFDSYQRASGRSDATVPRAPVASGAVPATKLRSILILSTVSHVSHLFHGELSDWCESRLTGTPDIARHIADKVHGVPLTRPSGRMNKYHWSQADRTFVNRLAELVQSAPPYSALHGLVRVGLVSMPWAHQQAASYPTHARLPADERERALFMRPTLRGWVDMQVAYDEGASKPTSSLEAAHRRKTRPGYPDEAVLAELFERMRAYVAKHARFGRIGPLGRETGLARISWLTGALAYAYRNDSIGHPLFRMFRDEAPTATALHASADDLAIEDPLALIERLLTSGALAEMRGLAAPGHGPMGVARPVIFDYWNESHLVLSGPNGATLLDVSSPVRVDSTERTGRRVWSLLASAWLDTSDVYRIRTVGIYLARHGTLITWPVEDLTYELVKGHDPHQAKSDFVDLARRLRARDNARRLDWRASQAEMREVIDIGAAPL